MPRESLNGVFETSLLTLCRQKVFHVNSVGRLNTVAHAHVLAGWLLPHLGKKTQATAGTT